jgi:hypothetical protein
MTKEWEKNQINIFLLVPKPWGYDASTLLYHTDSRAVRMKNCVLHLRAASLPLAAFRCLTGVIPGISEENKQEYSTYSKCGVLLSGATGEFVTTFITAHDLQCHESTC